MIKSIVLCAALALTLAACNNPGPQMNSAQYQELQAHEQENEIRY